MRRGRAIVEENADATAVHLECMSCDEIRDLDPVSYRAGKYVGRVEVQPPDDDVDLELAPPAPPRGLPSGNTPA